MSNYYRITAYHPTGDYSFIVDSSSRFEMLWQFSAYRINKSRLITDTSENAGDDILKINAVSISFRAKLVLQNNRIS